MKEFLEESVVEQMSKYYNATLELNDCWWYNGVKCKDVVRYLLRRWQKWMEENSDDHEHDGHKNDDHDPDDHEHDKRRRKRRSLLPKDNDPESDVKAETLCIKVDEKPAPPKVGAKMELIEIPVRDIDVSTLYTFDVRFYTCLFWDELKDEWSTRGCKVKKSIGF